MDQALKDWTPFAIEYDPLKAGSIDGTDVEPHDKAVSRAMRAHYEPPRNLNSKPERTLYVTRFGPRISRYDLKQFFSRYGEVLSVKIILDIVSGLSQCYGFVEMESVEDAKRVLRHFSESTLKGYQLFVDFECSRVMKGWKPRRLGGGFGGRKESGQLRFGGTDRPFKMPIVLDTSNL